MMKSNMQYGWRITYICILIVLCGCVQSREDQLFGFDTGAFIMFGILIIQAFALHSLQKCEWFQNARITIRKVLSPLSALGVTAGMVISIVGFGMEGLDRLLKFIGILVASFSFYLGKWSRTEDLIKQKLYMRVTTLSGTLTLMLYYFLKGAPGLK